MVALSTDRLTKVFDDGTVAVDDVTFDVASGEFLVLLGPTGCGKSTILRMVAGLEQPTTGQVYFDGQPADTLAARHRRVALVLQEHALYPHLTVAQNVAFPLRVGQNNGTDAAARVTEAAKLLGITGLLDRLPAQLSGGERQRVAIARALVRRPRLFLLDEPLSNIDAGLRAELRVEINLLARRLGVTTVYVTHDQTEAMTMADRVAVLRRGVLQQIGPPAQVYADPVNLFVAAFLGTPRTTLMQGAVYVSQDGRVDIDLGSQVLGIAGTQPKAAALTRHHTERLTVALRADGLRPVSPERTGLEQDAGQPDCTLRGQVRSVENLGHETLVYLDAGAVPTSAEVSQLELPESGQRLAGTVPRDARTGAGGLWHGLSWLLPQAREARRPTARTPYGFYPVYDPAVPVDAGGQGHLVVRVPTAAAPRVGDRMTVEVDLDRLLLFDRAGDRIRLP